MRFALPLPWVVLGVFGFLLAAYIAWKKSWKVHPLSSNRTPLPKQATVIRNKSDPVDVVIVGAGTAGAALAITLARQGRRVMVIERSLAIPDRIVGELLQPGGAMALERMGLEESIASTAINSASGVGTNPITLRYPMREPKCPSEFLGAVGVGTDTDGAKGRGYHNHLFVQALRDIMHKEPNVEFVEGRVVDVLKTGPGSSHVRGVVWVDKTNTRHEALAPFTVLCDGYYSVLRKHLTPELPVTKSHFAGLVLRHAEGCSPVLAQKFGHVVLVKPNPVLFYQIAPTETRVLVDIPQEHCNIEDGSVLRYFRDVVAPQLPEGVMRTSFLKAAEEQTMSMMPNKALWARPPTLTGAILIGDAWNTRHPLTGGGMTVCLRDVEILTRSLASVASFTDSKALQHAVDEFVAARKPHSATTNILANALHAVFTIPACDDGTRCIIQDACYDYLSKQGMRTQGPVGLLAGLAPRPIALILHFFCVALHGVTRLCFPLPTPAALVKSYKIIRTACQIIMPMIAEEGVTFMSTKPVMAILQLLFPWKAVKHE